jgi:hypothetical protein
MPIFKTLKLKIGIVESLLQLELAPPTGSTVCAVTGDNLPKVFMTLGERRGLHLGWFDFAFAENDGSAFCILPHDHTKSLDTIGTRPIQQHLRCSNG